ncbi:hypothetical protein [Bacillus xiapuensis]|uniref:Uncharacterized protein n=1 Tax=Bacillus xiapuensis TaxID=2014075 RepID=A0ABU6N4L7_9BACI|nr:hypothetical protein [Bacillus xiapuensis]
MIKKIQSKFVIIAMKYFYKGQLINGRIHWDELYSASDFLEWEALEDDRKELENKLDIQK